MKTDAFSNSLSNAQSNASSPVKNLSQELVTTLLIVSEMLAYGFEK